MVAFYRHWQKGKSKAEALQAAQEEVRKTHPSPVYWAAFVLNGDPGGETFARPVPTAGSTDSDSKRGPESVSEPAASTSLNTARGKLCWACAGFVAPLVLIGWLILRSTGSGGRKAATGRPRAR